VKRHRADIAGLLFGLAFMIYAGTFIASELSDTDIEPAWISAIAFVTLGVVALTATLLRGPRPAPALDALDDVEPTTVTVGDDSGERVDDAGEG
jgi:hypothetical protein